MVYTQLIRKRLELLEEYLEHLNRIKKTSLKDYSSKVENHAVAERFLHLSIELLEDLGNHIISSKKLGTVDVLRDVPHIFLKQEFITKKIHQTWINMIGLRNILVHAYANIDHTLVHRVLKNDLKDIEKIARILSEIEWFAESQAYKIQFTKHPKATSKADHTLSLQQFAIDSAVLVIKKFFSHAILIANQS